MKLLYYNWDLIDGHNGGGVTVYQKNLLTELVKTGKDQIYYLNSGWKYDNGGLRIERTENSFGNEVRSFEVVNSPVLAPFRQSGKNIQLYLEDKLLYNLIKDFIDKYGPFDVIHFNNMEGLSIKVFDLKKLYPQTKFIYSAHNYFPICSRVNLWKDEKRGLGHNCDKRDCLECVDCYSKSRYDSTINSRKSMSASLLKKVFIKVKSRIDNKLIPDKEEAKYYEQFESQTINKINENMDCVLAVSDRVKEILVLHGINERKTKVSYIGTKVADKQIGKCNTSEKQNPFSMIYMGYMRKDKGFYFFMEALEKIPEQMAKDISIRIVAKYDKRRQKSELSRIASLKNKFNSVELVNGYNPDNQKDLLQGMNLGIVPILWEDNLPQVAIEQIAYGVPIMVSDLGGAKELVQNPNFIFQSGNMEDFISKLMKVIEDRELLDAFWSKCRHLTTLHDHVTELRKIYEEK